MSTINRGEACLYDYNQYDNAVSDYSEAIRLRSDDADMYRKRADCYDALGKEVEANRDRAKVESLEKGNPSPSASTTPIPSNDDLARAAFDNGNAAAMKGDDQTAIANYSEAIRLKADFADAFERRGSIYYFYKQTLTKP